MEFFQPRGLNSALLTKLKFQPWLKYKKLYLIKCAIKWQSFQPRAEFSPDDEKTPSNHRQPKLSISSSIESSLQL